MSLAWRILLFALLLNVVTLGSVQAFVYFSQARWFERERENSMNSVLHAATELDRVYSPEALGDASADERQVRRLIASEAIREQYEDVILTSGRPPFEGVYLNPRGAVHRDPDSFPVEQIMRAIGIASEVPGTVPVAGGSCFAVRQEGEVVGFVWFRPKHPVGLPAALPFWSSVLGLLLGATAFGIVLSVVIRRTVGAPLSRLQEAARAVADGRYDARLPEGPTSGEFAPVMAAFNRMAAEVESHTATLEGKVRKAVEEAKQKERALVLSSRLASIGTLAAGVAHEVSNPIGGMLNAVNRLLQGEVAEDRRQKYLTLVREGLLRIATTTRRLLDFSPRIHEAKRFGLASVVTEARALVEHRIRRNGIVLRTELPDGLPDLRGDPHEMQQVVLNLLLNALDALEQKGNGGCIRIEAGRRGDRVLLTVADDGPGMAREDLGRVFDPFFTRKDRPDASGLGLFICYSIVQNHGGDLSVDSEPGKGFTVRIDLPTSVGPG